MSDAPSPENQVWLSRKQAAHYLSTDGYHITVSTLANMASNNNSGDGPRYYRFNWTRLRYRSTDLDEWKRTRIHIVE